LQLSLSSTFVPPVPGSPILIDIYPPLPGWALRSPEAGARIPPALRAFAVIVRRVSVIADVAGFVSVGMEPRDTQAQSFTQKPVCTFVSLVALWFNQPSS
jgi:hypothetical protein